MPPKKAASNAGAKGGKGSSGDDDKSKDKKAGTGSSVKVSVTNLLCSMSNGLTFHEVIYLGSTYSM